MDEFQVIFDVCGIRIHFMKLCFYCIFSIHENNISMRLTRIVHNQEIRYGFVCENDSIFVISDWHELSAYFMWDNLTIWKRKPHKRNAQLNGKKVRNGKWYKYIEVKENTWKCSIFALMLSDNLEGFVGLLCVCKHSVHTISHASWSRLRL